MSLTLLKAGPGVDGTVTSPSVRVLASNAISVGPSANLSVVGASIGQIAIAAQCYCLNGTPAFGWNLVGAYTWATYGYFTNVCSRILTGPDIAAGFVTLNNMNNDSPVVMDVISNGTAASLVSTQQSATGVLNIPGFAKNVASKYVMTFTFDRDPASPIVNPPAGFISATNSTGGPLFTGALADLVSTAYVNGTAANWTGFTVGNEQMGGFIEVV